MFHFIPSLWSLWPPCSIYLRYLTPCSGEVRDPPWRCDVPLGDINYSRGSRPQHLQTRARAPHITDYTSQITRHTLHLTPYRLTAYCSRHHLENTLQLTAPTLTWLTTPYNLHKTPNKSGQRMFIKPAVSRMLSRPDQPREQEDPVQPRGEMDHQSDVMIWASVILVSHYSWLCMIFTDLTL